MADAEYVIDISANMPDGEVTARQLDKITEKLMGGGRESDAFAQAIQKVSSQLGAAQKATALINGELSQAQEEYRQLERTALLASRAVERAMKKGEVPPELVGDLDRAQAAVNGYAGKLQDLERRAEGAAAAERKLSRTLDNTRKAAAHVDKTLGDNVRKLSTFRGALGDVGGPIGELGERLLYPVQGFMDLTEEFGSAKAAAVVLSVGLASLAVSVAALGVIAAAVTVTIAAFAVKLADTRRAAALSREAIEAMNPRLKALRGEFAALNKETGVAEDALIGLEKKLNDAGVSAADMPRALKAAATAEAALGAGGADQFIKDIKEGKLSVDSFANTAQQNLGGIVERQMLGLGASTDRLKRNFSELFGSLDIEPALKAYRKFVDMFDETTEIGGAIKFLFTEFFQPIIDSAEKAVTVIEAFVIGFLIGLTELYIALKPTIKAIAEFFGFDGTDFLNTLQTAEDLGNVLAKVFFVVAVAIGVVTAAVGAVIAVFGLAVIGVYALLETLFKLGYYLGQGLRAAFDTAVSFFSETDWGALGRNVVEGLANGIRNAAGMVVSAVTGAVNGAINAAKRLLGIASPSKVFAEFGGFTGEGFAMGVEDETDRAQAALQGLVEPPDIRATPYVQSGAQAVQASPIGGGGGSDAGAALPGSAGASVSLSGVTFNFYGVQGAEDAEAKFRETLTRVLEGDAAALGGEVA